LASQTDVEDDLVSQPEAPKPLNNVVDVRADLKRPLRALRIEVFDAPALDALRDLDAWLAEHAPHIQTLG